MKHKALLVTLDGGVARFFERNLPLGILSEIACIQNDLIDVMPESHHQKPGRVFESGNTARHAYDKDEKWRDVQKQKFIQFLVNYLEENYLEYEEIYICCPAKILGMLREQLSPRLGAKITRQYTKDFVKNTTQEISEFIDATPF